MFLYQSLSLTTRSMTFGPGILPVTPLAIAHPRRMPAKSPMIGTGERLRIELTSQFSLQHCNIFGTHIEQWCAQFYITGGFLDNMLWDSVISKLSAKDRAICAQASKTWRSAVIRSAVFYYMVYEDTLIDDPSATLIWKLIPIPCSSGSPTASTLNITLHTRGATAPFWQHSRTVDKIDKAFASVVENAISHTAFDSLNLICDPDTMPILLHHIPPTIRISIASLVIKTYRGSTVPTQPCFQGLLFVNLKSLTFGGEVSDIQDIPNACPHLSHVQMQNSRSDRQLQHLRKLPQLVDLSTWGSWSDVEGLTGLTRLCICGCHKLPLYTACTVLPSFTNLRSLTVIDSGLMTASEVLSMQTALDFIAPILSGLRDLRLKSSLSSILVISNAFTALQSIHMTSKMQLASSVATGLSHLIMSTEEGDIVPAAAAAAVVAGEAAAVPVNAVQFPASCTHIRAPMHKLCAAVSCAMTTHLAIDPMRCEDMYMTQLLSSVKAGAWPEMVEVMMRGHTSCHEPSTIVPYTENLLLLDAIASRPGVSTLQRVSISALWVQVRGAADEAVDILCRIPSLRHVRICHYEVTQAHLVQLASQKNIKIVDVMDGGIDEAGCAAAQALVDGATRINWIDRAHVNDMNY